MLAAALLLLAALGRTADPLPTLRLPAGPRPMRQKIDLTVIPSSPTFEGTTEIDLELPTGVSRLFLNATGLKVGAVTLMIRGERHKGRARLAGTDFVEIAFGSLVGPGKGRLSLAFSGRVSRKDAYGVFEKREGGEPYVFTQFEAIAARRAVPCFDEPEFKIPFQVVLNVPKRLAAVSNTPIASSVETGRGMKTVVFRETKPIPTYLVAFAVGPFEFVDVGAVGRGRVPTRIVVPRGRASQTTWAKEVTPRILDLLEAYVDRPYPYEKLDELAIPEVSFAMEHPGLVTYSEGLLLGGPDQGEGVKRQFAETCAHELAHQWFGNLVTASWWDDVWLSESFANWLAAKITNRLDARWDTRVDLVAGRSEALDADSLKSARRVREPITSDEDIEDAFDAITYGKGEALLEMFEAWIGEDLFKRGLQSYLESHAFGTATSEDLISALSAASGRDLKRPFASYLLQVGAPVISSEVQCDGKPRVILTQTGSSSSSWEVPVCLAVGTRGERGERCTLVNSSRTEVALATCPEWVYPNAGGFGYFRAKVGKDEISRAISSGRLSDAETVSLIYDISALVASGDMGVGDALELARSFSRSSDSRTMRADAHLVGGIGKIVPQPLRGHFAELVEGLFGDKGRRLGLAAGPQEDEETGLLRATLLEILCREGHDTALRRETASLVRQWVSEPGAAIPASPMLSLGGRYGDRTLFDRVSEEIEREPDRGRRDRLLMVLGSFRDPDLLRSALEFALRPTVDAEGAVLILTSAFGDPETAPVVYSFLKEHYEAVVAKLPTEFGAALPLVGAPFCDESHRDDLREFLGARLGSLVGGRRSLARAIETIDSCIAERKTQERSLSSFFGSAPGSPQARPN